MNKLEIEVEKEVSAMYGIADSRKAKLKFFIELLNLNPGLVGEAGDAELDAMALTVIYRHLDRIDRIKAMTVIRSLPNSRLQNSLVTKVLDSTFVNRSWEIWSKTNNELMSDKNFHELLDKYATYIGVGASAMGIKDLFKEIIKNKKMSKKDIITLVLWLAIYYNKSLLDRNNEEINRRKNDNFRKNRFY